jgi:DNA polymerase-3 subunit gamma/tau
MAYLSLYRKHRPQTFDEILGQEAVSTTLANAIAEDRVAHAYLFTGPRGTGKTSTARILAKALNCVRGPTARPCGECPSCIAIAEGSSLDVIEMDAASHSKVDETRDILAGVPLATAGGRRKVYVIDEVHMLSPGSFNALLKTLEEPPDHVVFILATTEAHKVLPTIVSRTQRFDFRRVPVAVLGSHLETVAKLEGIDVEPGALSLIARHADGSVRDALTSLDQLASLSGRVSEEDAQKVLGERGADALLELFDAIRSADVGSVFGIVHSLVAGGADPRQLALGALTHARSLLLLRTAGEAQGLLDVAPEDRPRLVEQAERWSNAGLVRALDLVAKAVTEMRNAPNHRLLLEVALVRAAAPETDPSATGLLGRIERLERRLAIEGAAAPPAAREEVAAGDGAPAQDAIVGEDRSRAPEDAVQARKETAIAQHVGLGHIKDAWPATLKEVNKRSKRVWGLLTPSRPVRFEDDSFVVEVQSTFHQQSMSEERNRGVLAESLHAALGIRPGLTFVARGTQPAETTTNEDAELTAIEGEPEDPLELVKKGLSAEVVDERSRL